MSQAGAVDHFGASRYRYVHPPDGDGIFCVGNVAECDHLTVDGAVRIPWGGTPRQEDVAKIRSLHLCPTTAQRRKAALPAYLPDLVNLESLMLPTPFVPHLSADGIGERVTTLVIGHDHTDPVPAAPLPGDVAVPGLRALMWVSSVVPPTLAQVVDPLPPLEFLRTNVSGDEVVLRQVRQLATLRHLELVDVGNADVVDFVTAPVRTLEIAGTGRDFPLSRLAALPTVAALRLNGVRSEVDCSVFRELPGLVELTVLNSRKIGHLEALLECQELASITFVNCGNPFKKGGKALFKAREFARLDIDYS